MKYLKTEGISGASKHRLSIYEKQRSTFVDEVPAFSPIPKQANLSLASFLDGREDFSHHHVEQGL
jgi:hypothetical protein